MRAGRRRGRERGFTYLGVLFIVGVIGLGLAGTGATWTIAARRAHERQLLWTGKQYARAIQAYWQQSPGIRQYPSRLDDLVADDRFPVQRHHLRELYRDPVSGEPFAPVLSPEGRIAGVHSPSDATPLKQDGFSPPWQAFKGMTRYSDWLFIAESARPALATPGQAAQGPQPAQGPQVTQAAQRP
ncbi:MULTISPECIES: type II secretion system protein [Ramlibacter]|uniref:type II secretion system protein n=1 Tax=Ramlibacter TaxID=174951 RepID=UPI0018DF5089|nr:MULTISPECIES: type II secretion system protein [Ramlibacter]